MTIKEEIDGDSLVLWLFYGEKNFRILKNIYEFTWKKLSRFAD